jgi:hypothetical protein
MALTSDQRRALALLASDERGVTEDLMLANGFRGKMLAGLVLAGLATIVTETVRAGAATIKVECYRITDAGRATLDNRGGKTPPGYPSSWRQMEQDAPVHLQI